MVKFNNITEVTDEVKTWLTDEGNFGNISSLPMHDQYFFSFYFNMGTLTSTMGYGDIVFYFIVLFFNYIYIYIFICHKKYYKKYCKKKIRRL